MGNRDIQTKKGFNRLGILWYTINITYIFDTLTVAVVRNKSLIGLTISD